MTHQEQLINLQDRMTALQKLEAQAYASKIEAERKINECGDAWYSIWGEYMKVKEKLNSLK